MSQPLILPLPPSAMMPLVERALRQRGERWQRHITSQAVEWQPVAGHDAPLPGTLLLAPDPRGGSRLTLSALNGKPLSGEGNSLLKTLSDSADEHNRQMRSRVYGVVAKNRSVPSAQRLHAARILGESDPVRAAQVLGELVMHHRDDAIGVEALAALPVLKGAAKPTLWWLDAVISDGPLALTVAQALSEIGDVGTAGYRLEQLARQGDERLQGEALVALMDIGRDSMPRMISLMQRAPDEVRLTALRWLTMQGEATPEMTTTLGLLATSLPAAQAREAVMLLGRLNNHQARQRLRHLLHTAPNSELRLAAAEELHQMGDTLSARAVLLELAQGQDGEAADAALSLLTREGGGAVDEASLVMQQGKLRTIRRRAAEALSQPHQPPEIQQQAALVLLALDYPSLARPVLTRLAGDVEDVERQRWAAKELARLGERAADDMLVTMEQVEDPVAGQYLAEGVLAVARSADEQRRAALWLAGHSNLPRAVEILGDLALSARVTGSDAVQATNELAGFAPLWAGAGRVLAVLATESPHPAVRARALDLMLREHPADMPLTLLVDLAVTGSLGPIDRLPVVQQLNALAQPAAVRIAARIATSDDTDQRKRLLQVMNELPDKAVTPALLQLNATTSSSRLRYVAAQQLIARGQARVGYATLATLVLEAKEPMLRESALYELALGLPDTQPLLSSVVERTKHEEIYNLARHLLHSQRGSMVEALTGRWKRWVASLPLNWVDRLVGR